MDDKTLNGRLAWRRSGDCNGLNCVEVASLPEGGVAIRDSKDEGRGPVHRFTPEEWTSFRDGVRRGEFDNL